MSWESAVFAQPFSKTEVKTELTLKFISHVFWEDEDRFDSLKIAFVGSDPQYYKSLTEAVVGRQIRGKSIQLTEIDSLDTLMNYQVLVVAAKTRLPFSEIALKARHTNTLVVSEQKNDQTHIMINLLQSADGTFSFELNRANILLEKLSFSSDILLLGGTELDVARLYREMEEDLELLVLKLNETQEQSSLANVALIEKQNQLDAAQSKLTRSQSLLQTVNEALESQTETISSQEAIIVSRQAELDLVSASADEKQKQLQRSSVKISEQQERVRQNEELLRSQ